MLLWLASALAWLLTVCALGFATVLLICGGPIASIIGYRAMVRRLTVDDPENPLLPGTWEPLTAARQRRVVVAYCDAYGVDVNVGLAIGGLAMTIPAWYLSGYTAQWLTALVPTTYV
jgi:hypothetical protein